MVGFQPTTVAVTEQRSTIKLQTPKQFIKKNIHSRVSEDSNLEPTVYKTTALPLSYSPKIFFLKIT